MWYYISHLGNHMFTSEDRLDYDDLYCDECGDSDTELGWFATEQEAETAYYQYWNS